MKEETKKEIYTPEEKHLTCNRCGAIMNIYCDMPIDKDDYRLCSQCKEE
jgi:hypothetical protein